MIYIVIILFVGWVISEAKIEEEESRRRRKNLGGGNSDTFSKDELIFSRDELINKLEKYINTDFNGINDIYKKKSWICLIKK